MPRKPPKCRRCCACHKMFKPAPKCCPCHAKRGRQLRAGMCSTTSSPFRAIPNFVCATQTYTQMQDMLRLPRILQASSKVLPLSRKTRPSAARWNVLDNIKSLQSATKFCLRHAQMQEMLRLPRNLQAVSKVLRLATSNPLPHAACATQTSPKRRKCCADHQISKVLRLSRKTGPQAARSTTSNPFRQLHVLLMPREHAPRCRRCCACHKMSSQLQSAAPVTQNKALSCALECARQHQVPSERYQNFVCATQTYTQMQEMLRLPRNLQAISKVLRLSSKTGSSAARLTTSGACRQLPNAVSATQTYTQCRKCCACHEILQNLQKSAAPVTQNKTGPSAARSTTSSPFRQLQMLPMPRKRTPKYRRCCACHETCKPFPKCCACQAKRTDNMQSF